MRRAGRLVTIAALAGVQLGCLVEITTVSDPARAFRTARAEAARYQGRPGPAHHLNVLVYDPGDRELVRVSLPFWMAKKCQGHFDWVDWDDERGDRIARRVGRHVRVEDLDRAGLGVLADVEDEDGSQVFVWLR